MVLSTSVLACLSVALTTNRAAEDAALVATRPQPASAGSSGSLMSPPASAVSRAKEGSIASCSASSRSTEVSGHLDLNRNYGWQVAVGDVGGLMLTGLIYGRTHSDWAIVPYLAASPIVHGFHRDPGGAVGALALHALLPLAGMLGAVATGTRCHNDTCGLSSTVVTGWIVGSMVAATAIDALLLSNERITLARQGPRVAPVVVPSLARGAAVGVVAVF